MKLVVAAVDAVQRLCRAEVSCKSLLQLLAVTGLLLGAEECARKEKGI